MLVVREPLSSRERAALGRHTRLDTSQAAAEFLTPRLAREEVEIMVLVALDGQNRVRHVAEIARGGMHGCSVTSKDILRAALIAGSSGFILAHNHPSGDPTPSGEDVVMSRSVQEAGEVVGVKLLDHIIIAGNRHSSLLDLGLL